MWVIAKIFWQKRLLNIARDSDLLLEALAFAFTFDQARVVENACGVGGQCVENLSVELGKCRRAFRIEIQDTKKLATGYVGG